jgi:hypothetical protein
MTASWSIFRELLIPPGTRCRAVEGALRQAIRVGRLPAGTRLPSSRDLAAQLGVARGTITLAYTQLTAEGYLVARRGSGTVVSDSVAGTELAGQDAEPDRVWRYDLRPGLPALSAFPRAAWLAATRAGMAGLSDAELGYPDRRGEPSASRSGGTVHHPRADPRAHPGGRERDALARTDCRVVMATTAHQFPLGVAPLRHGPDLGAAGTRPRAGRLPGQHQQDARPSAAHRLGRRTGRPAHETGDAQTLARPRR